MQEKYSIKDGRTEAVIWILYRDNKILIESRPISEQGESTCIPCGHIDLNRDKNNYIKEAFLREIQEEFEIGNFIPSEYKFLTTIDFDEINKNNKIDKFKLHYFVVTKWSGKVPQYTTENNKKHSDLTWIPISKYQNLPQSCDKEAIEILLKTKL